MLQAQRNELNAKVRMLREELQHLQEQCSYVGEVTKSNTLLVLVPFLLLDHGVGLPCSSLVMKCTGLWACFSPNIIHFFPLIFLINLSAPFEITHHTQVVKPMDKKKVLVKVHPEGKFVVDVDKNIDINDVTPNCR